MNWLLDTDTCVYFLRGEASIRAKITEVGREKVGISVISLVELRYGAEFSADSVANHTAVDNFIAGLAVVGVDDLVARNFAKIKTELRRKGSLIPDFDLLIGATAITHKLTLVTNNTAHFNRVPELKIESWLASQPSR